MPNNNVAILSIMSKFDEKSAREAAKKANRVYEEALSDIGNTNFSKELVDQFSNAMNLIKKSLKGLNLSSYTNNILDSLFSDKDIEKKSADIQSFIKNIENLHKSLGGLGNNDAFKSIKTQQLDAIINKQKKIEAYQNKINEKTKEYEDIAKKASKTNRTLSTIEKNYGNQDYSKTLESLQKTLGTEKEFTNEQKQSIGNLAKMLNLYQIMEKSEPQKGTIEAIKYSKDLLRVTEEIRAERDKIDSFSSKGASKFISSNGLDSINKVNNYTVNDAKNNFVNSSIADMEVQKAKMQSELTTYVSDAVKKNLEKISNDSVNAIEKAEKKVGNLQSKIEDLNSISNKNKSQKSIIDIPESDIKTLEEIEDRLYKIYDLDSDGKSTNNQLKEYIQLYKQYEQLVSNDSTVKFDPSLKEEYESIINSNNALKKFSDSLDETISKQKELNTINPNNTIDNSQTEQLAKQEKQIEETVQAEERLVNVQGKVSSNTKIFVDTEEAIKNINKLKENLDKLPDTKEIKIKVSSNDYSNTPLLTNESGEVVTAFRGVTNAWSGLINDKGISFFTDKLKLAADYADSLAESGKVYQANLSFKNPLEIEGNGAKWNEINFNGVKKTTDEIVEIAKQLGHDGVIFKNIRDGFTDTNDDISNVMVALNASQIKNEQVIGSVKAGTGEMVDVVSKIDTATNTASNSTVESQNKIQEELKETQKVAEQVSEAMSNVCSDKSGSQIKGVFQGDNKSATDASTTAIKEESKALEQVSDTAKEASASKEKFADANKNVKASAESSSTSLSEERVKLKDVGESAEQESKQIQRLAEEKRKLRQLEKQSVQSSVNKALKDQVSAWKQIQSIREKIAKTNNTDEISKLKESKNYYQKQYNNANKILKANDGLYDKESQIAKLEQVRLETNVKLAHYKQQQVETLASIVNGYYKDYDNRNQKPTDMNRSTEYQQALNKYHESIVKLEEEKERLSKLPSITNEELNRFRKLEKEVQKNTNAFKAMSAAEKGSTAISRRKEIDKISKYLKENTKLSEEAKRKLQEYIRVLQDGDGSTNVEKIHNEFLKVAVAERMAGREGKSFLDIFKNKVIYGFASQLAMYYLSFYDFIRYARNAINAVKELDTALIDLKKTTTMSASELEQFYYDSNDVAKQMGVSTKEIIEQASAWSRFNKIDPLYSNVY